MTRQRFRTVSFLSSLLVAVTLSSANAGAPSAGQVSVVKIYVTIQTEDYSMPWQAGDPGGATGSGFIIRKNRILTNAHIISDAKFIEIQKYDDPERFKAKVAFVGHDCDLAVLTVDDPDFFVGTRPAKFADDIPSLSDEVTVIGYPLGGNRLSLTRGVVSRIDYSVYTHSEVDQHLVLQVDAAINPGNSGGPVLFKNKVVGLAFQGLAMAENIGYAIPLPVIDHFLKDIEDGKYNGYPELGVGFMPLRNAALRRDLNLPEGKSGIAVYYVDPFGSARGLLRNRDVLVSVDAYPIANDGTIDFGGNSVLFAELLERKQWGEFVTFKVWRDNAEIAVKIPLTNPEDPFVYRNVYDKRPEYYITGGLVFAPLNREYLQTLRKRAMIMNTQQLLYYSEYAKVDELYKDKDEFVVLTGRLPHSINTYCDAFLNGIVTNINGKAIGKLEDVKNAMVNHTGTFHVVYFAGMNDTLVTQSDVVRQADREILSRYHIPSPEYFGEK